MLGCGDRPRLCTLRAILQPKRADLEHAVAEDMVLFGWMRTYLRVMDSEAMLEHQILYSMLR